MTITLSYRAAFHARRVLTDSYVQNIEVYRWAVANDSEYTEGVGACLTNMAEAINAISEGMRG